MTIELIQEEIFKIFFNSKCWCHLSSKNWLKYNGITPLENEYYKEIENGESYHVYEINKRPKKEVWVHIEHRNDMIDITRSMRKIPSEYIR